MEWVGRRGGFQGERWTRYLGRRVRRTQPHSHHHLPARWEVSTWCLQIRHTNLPSRSPLPKHHCTHQTPVPITRIRVLDQTCKLGFLTFSQAPTWLAPAHGRAVAHTHTHFGLHIHIPEPHLLTGQSRMSALRPSTCHRGSRTRGMTIMHCAVDDVDERWIHHPSFPWKSKEGVCCCFALVELDERPLGPQWPPNLSSPPFPCFMIRT